MGLTKRKNLITAAVVICIAVMVVIIAFAYSGTTDEITNTFSIGNVRIRLTETEYPGNNVSLLVPNEEISKNPQVNNIGINSAFVFLKVSVPKREVITADAYGNCTEKELQEIFYMKTNENDVYKTEHSFSDSWIELEAYREDREDTKTYVFGYENALGALKATEPLFDKVQLKNIIEQQIDPEQIQEITIKAYAVQSENIPQIDKNSGLTAEELEKIYQMIESK